MEIKFFCPRWGCENMSWDAFCSRVKDAGYDGVETPIPFDADEKHEIVTALKKHDLLLIGQYYQSFEKDLEQHKQDFKKHLENITALNPVLIDSQTGKDYYTADENRELFELAATISRATGVVIAHETHRNKALFAAHITRQLLTDNPDLVITADFSHWCNVSESLLEQQADAVNFAVSRSVHIHARVGHSQSAQISDPSAAEWKNEVDAHLAWWDAIVKFRLERGESLLTITPEFGPFPYLLTLPYKGLPVVNQWNINVYMLKLLKQRYKLLSS
ncbi:sugar phosphate isomerase/epimerase family protein [Mucilaginibacter sp. X4EP1]|uniref:sugar phosphate isomerase/epimerase family protein n=1 Tax=Mucilaginibacter sp. X4EP1 TaxID=2723092 RepID=UPI00216848A4|nr:sugar phosphate isomerase/epimerase [Mucilaginibacter sp. X4EP1]MCS3815514.1 sugar phosphate isomerase/epimerase [Mucilaginibacter sp. X4EP1]